VLAVQGVTESVEVGAGHPHRQQGHGKRLAFPVLMERRVVGRRELDLPETLHAPHVGDGVHVFTSGS
jgi:hypothetical protein